MRKIERERPELDTEKLMQQLKQAGRNSLDTGEDLPPEGSGSRVGLKNVLYYIDLADKVKQTGNKI